MVSNFEIILHTMEHDEWRVNVNFFGLKTYSLRCSFKLTGLTILEGFHWLIDSNSTHPPPTKDYSSWKPNCSTVKLVQVSNGKFEFQWVQLATFMKDLHWRDAPKSSNQVQLLKTFFIETSKKETDGMVEGLKIAAKLKGKLCIPFSHISTSLILWMGLELHWIFRLM